ncbi:carbohydrate porin [Cystobacter fuscus]|uniref:carbohydrate porin n=1 Tax=Cystobacter fuscus TaxID=43 RepID=UPI002B2E6098|nr:carbohydrate porin [Cystobacter fuscus]
MTLSSTPTLSRLWRVCLMLCVIALAAGSTSADASLLYDRLEISMYGRMGAAWDPTSGRYVMGQRMNVTGSAIGGRLEEGDYLEPAIKLHLLAPSTDTSAPYVDFVITPAMYSQNGLFAGGPSSNGDPLVISLSQAYIESGNILLPNLRVWGGARFYRGTDVHIADIFYFNNLVGQGGGVMYGPLDLAIIMQGSLNSPQYNFDVNGDGRLGSGDIRRQRTVFVAQYVHKLESGHSFHGLAELHLLPAVKVTRDDGTQVGLNADLGWVLGAKAHFDLGNGSFNDVSFRYGSRAASGARGGAQTYYSFGQANTEGVYDDSAGIQAVDHFLYNFGSSFSLNAYAILHWSQGLRNLTVPEGGPGTTVGSAMDFGVGARGEYYFTDHLHLIGEVHYQGVKQAEIASGDLATALKLTIAPTFVPLGGRTMWARPHFRLFYTAAFYNDAAAIGLVSSYQQAVSDNGRPVKVGHYLGTRVEWWF